MKHLIHFSVMLLRTLISSIPLPQVIKSLSPQIEINVQFDCTALISQRMQIYETVSKMSSKFTSGTDVISDKIIKELFPSSQSLRLIFAEPFFRKENSLLI